MKLHELRSTNLSLPEIGLHNYAYTCTASDYLVHAKHL